MKGLLAILIGLFILIGCSKDDRNNSREIPSPNILELFDISPNDTTGLKLCGVASIDCYYGIAVLGNKNGYLWVQILERKEDNTFKKITNFTTTAKFNDRIEIDLGYGEKEVIKANYVDWNAKIYNVISNDLDKYAIFFHDENHFLLYRNYSWIICDDKIFERRNPYQGTLANGYIGGYNLKVYVCDETGEPLYEYDDKFKNYTFINIYEYIDYSKESICRCNAKTGKRVWETRFEKMGQVIDGHEPKIEHSIKITGEYAECTFNITNYDGSKETKKYNVDIETGEITEL